MEEQTLYRVCPERNVEAAFACFLGPDSGSLERFLEDHRTHWRDAVRVVRTHGGRALAHGAHAFAGAVHPMRQGAQSLRKGVADLNLVLTLLWMSACYALLTLAWASRTVV